MHAIHTTAGFVVGSRPYGDAGKILSIFTRDFGLIFATAQGIRLEKSKLRYFIQDYSWGVYSFVRGKEYWRLTSAQGMEKVGSEGGGDRDLVARVALLLKRFLQGEDPHPELFDSLESSLLNILIIDRKDIDRLASLESIVVYRVLHLLGYIGKDQDIGEEIRFGGITHDLLDRVSLKRKIINQHINKALQESHL
ncbi:MAG: recombination protein O N-terminal domain-containing protein [Candidatus Taylorbacteria bacterium]